MAEFDQARAVRQGESLDADLLGTYLKDTLSGVDGPVTIRQFHSGYSNLTYLVDIGDSQFVLRRPPFGKKAKTAHDMHREYRILSALKPVFPYVPAPLAYCDDPTIMDTPFYVMERLNGIILRKDLPASLNVDAPAAGRLCEQWVDVLAQLHRLNWERCGLADLGNPAGYIGRQIRGWTGRFRDAHTDDVPDFEAVMAWLHDRMPAGAAPAALIHNDYKFDNVILDPAAPTRIIGVLDWEMATIGDPVMDLGAALGYWVQADDSDELKLIRTLPTAAAGMLTRKQIVDLYRQQAGHVIGDFAWYYCFGLFRLAVIAQQIYYRFYHGQTHDKRFQMLGFAIGILEKAATRVMETGDY